MYLGIFFFLEGHQRKFDKGASRVSSCLFFCGVLNLVSYSRPFYGNHFWKNMNKDFNVIVCSIFMILISFYFLLQQSLMNMRSRCDGVCVIFLLLKNVLVYN